MKSFRQKEIIDILSQDGVISTAALSERFGVSIETIRRDLDQLEKQGVLKKTYGGAELKTKPHVWPTPLTKRLESSRGSKAAMAAHAMRYVDNNSTIALDAGSTILELCRLLKNRQNMILLSCDIHSATELLTVSNNNKVYMMGGFLTPYGTSSGTYAREFLNSITGIDTFLFSTDGVDPDDGLSTDESGINDLKKLYLKKAKTRIAMIDHSKFQRKAFYRMCAFSDIDILITDSETPADIIESIRRRGTQVDVIDA